MNSLSQRTGLSGSALKWIAIVTMLIDHVGAVLVLDWYVQQPTAELYNAYYLMRTVGRIAFPIFCFLLVEGFFHTRDRRKYALRLGLFCLVAEPPFDLALEGRLFQSDDQNVFFTLLFGFLAMWGSWELSRRQNWHPALASAVMLIPCGIGAALLQTDYDCFGVLLILALFVGRSICPENNAATRLVQLLLGSFAILWYCWANSNWLEIYAVLGLVLTLLYSGQRGNGPKWFFYWFYPVHLTLLGIVKMILF